MVLFYLVLFEVEFENILRNIIFYSNNSIDYKAYFISDLFISRVFI